MFGGIPALSASNLARERVLPTPNSGRRGGEPEVLASLTLDELNDWLSRYHPGTATLSIAGPVDATTTLDLVDRLFAPIPSGDPPPPAAPTTPGESGLTVAAGTADAADGLIALAYAAPTPVDSAYPAFLIAAGRLFVAQGPSLMTAFAPIDDPAVLTVTGPMLQAETPEGAAARLKSEIDRIVTEPLQEGEVTQTAQIFGPLLGFGVTTNTYGVAFSAARRPTLGLHPDPIEHGLAAIDDVSYQALIGPLIVDTPITGAVVTGNSQ